MIPKITIPGVTFAKLQTASWTSITFPGSVTSSKVPECCRPAVRLDGYCNVYPRVPLDVVFPPSPPAFFLFSIRRSSDPFQSFIFPPYSSSRRRSNPMDGVGGGGGGEREIIYLSQRCHHQNYSCIKMGSDESHFNISVGSDGRSHKTVSTNHNLFEDRGEPKRYRLNRGPSAYWQPDASLGLFSARRGLLCVVVPDCCCFDSLKVILGRSMLRSIIFPFTDFIFSVYQFGGEIKYCVL